MKTFFPALICILSASAALAQHHQHEIDTTGVKQENVEASGHNGYESHAGPPMSHAFSLNLPMNRNGSGTGWLSDSAPMYGYMLHSKKWMYMVHGNVFVRYNVQDVSGRGERGDRKFDIPNWFMAMGQRQVGARGLFHFNAMFSLDPLFGGEGYPLLFQTGETHQGKALVDRQHPHNLFSELSVAYAHAFSKDADAFVYLGYPGEPALGPVAFMHRPSSLNNPDSPLGHHWQDATHITFGVATAGIRYKIIKLDASLFTGREPGEARYGFDRAKFDSYSYRVSVNPSAHIALQASRAFIKSPEAIEPDEDIKRTTASVLHSLPLRAKNAFLTSAFIWGYNDSGEDHRENSFTVETNLQLKKLALYGRYENIEKSASELQLEDVDPHDIFTINALTLGLNYILYSMWNTNFSLGAQSTLYAADPRLDPVYGDHPASVEMYLRVSPVLMRREK